MNLLVLVWIFGILGLLPFAYPSNINDVLGFRSWVSDEAFVVNPDLQFLFDSCGNFGMMLGKLIFGEEICIAIDH